MQAPSAATSHGPTVGENVYVTADGIFLLEHNIGSNIPKWVLYNIFYTYVLCNVTMLL